MGLSKETRQGNGKPSIRVRTPPGSELSEAVNPITDEAEAALVPGNRVPKDPMARMAVAREAAAKMGRKPKLMMLGMDMSRLDIHDLRYKNCLYRSDHYFKRRSRELCVAFGYVSVGVSAMLSTSALSLAASKYVQQLAAEEAGRDVKQFAVLMELAVKLGKDARQGEILAWELCAKEQGQVKRQNEMVPWLETQGVMDTKDEGPEDGLGGAGDQDLGRIGDVSSDDPSNVSAG